MTGLLHMLVTGFFFVSLGFMPILLAIGSLCYLFVESCRRRANFQRKRVNRSNKAEWDREDNEIKIIELEAFKIKQEAREMERENELERARQAAKGGLP